MGSDSGPSRTFSIEAVFSLGWTALKAQYGPVLLALVAYILLALAIGLVQYTVEQAIGARGLLSVPIGIFVTGPLAAGLAYFGVLCVRAEAVKTGDIFLGFRRYWVLVGIQALMMLVAALFMAPVYVIAMTGGMSGRNGLIGFVVMDIGILIVTALMIAVVLRFSLAALVALDDDGLGVFDSLRQSWQMTRGPNWALIFVVCLLLGLISIACAVALILPLFFLAMPLGVTVWGAKYDLLAGSSRETPAA